MLARRYGLSFYVALVVFLAIFVNAPLATLEVSWEAFKAIGEFGGSVVSELASGGSVGQ